MAARYRMGRRLLVPARSGWHQFRVLTTRYFELVFRDRRSLRLLLLQAPIVGILLVIGLAHVDYHHQLPRSRRLGQTERDTLNVLHGLSAVAEAAEAPTLPEERRKELEKLRFQAVTGGGEVAQYNGYQLAQCLRSLRNGNAPPGASVLTRSGMAQLLSRARGGQVDPDLEKLRNAAIVLHTLEGGEDAASERRSAIALREVVALSHGLSKVGAKDLPQQLLTIDSPRMPVVPVGTFVEPKAWIVVFIVSIAVFWFGCNNAAKEIVKEEAVYSRERSANLGILPYLGSKFLVLSLISIVQTFLLMVIVYGGLYALHAVPPMEYLLPEKWVPALNGATPTFAQFLWPLIRFEFPFLMLLGVTGTAAGLLLSASVASPDRANALTPYVLIPQMILGGSFIPIEGVGIKMLAGFVSPVYWSYRALHRGMSKLPEYLPVYHDPEYSLTVTTLALTAQLAVLLLATAWFLRRKDVGAGEQPCPTSAASGWRLEAVERVER